jgi:hypothetical protein
MSVVPHTALFVSCSHNQTDEREASPSGGDHLVELPNIALSDLILGDVRVISVHKIGYGQHDCDRATA